VPVTVDLFPRLGSVLHKESMDQEQGNLSPDKLRAGDLCPQCKEEQLDYDGLLNLSCLRCGYAVGGCFT
jgi:hypothetical protein